MNDTLKKLIKEVAKIGQQEVRWRVAQVFPRLTLSRPEHAAAATILTGHFNNRSKIVKTSSMQALADLAEREPSLQSSVTHLLEELTETGGPAMKSRSRKLLERLNRSGERT